MKKIHLLVSIPLACIFLTCQEQQKTGEGSQSTSEKDESTQLTGTQPETPPADDTFLLTWVDNLNIRATPSTAGETVAVVKSGTPLEFIRETSENSENIVLRGVSYNEPWLKITTPDKTVGWVFGGAVQHKGETKGNEIMTAERFEFPHFGSFNLDTWEKQTTKDESGGDAEIMTNTYKKENEILEISKSDMGDYGYGHTYRLMSADRKLLKERQLNFVADAEIRELTETVKDFTVQPAKQYMRVQKFDKHHSQLNALPIMANGVWVESTL